MRVDTQKGVEGAETLESLEGRRERRVGAKCGQEWGK